MRPTRKACPRTHSAGSSARRNRRIPSDRAAGWCDAARCPRCSGVKQKVTVTSNSASASICRSNQAERIRPKAVGPGQAGPEVPDAEPPHPGDGVVEPMILEMKPLAQPHRWRVSGKRSQRRLWASRPRATAPCGNAGSRTSPPPPCAASSPPRPRQIVEAVPVNARRPADQQFGGALQTPGLDLFRAKRGDADFGDPDRQIG